MICDGYARGGSLGIVDQNIDPAESIHRLLHHILYDCFIVCPCADIRLYGKYLDAVLLLQFFLCIGQLLHVTTGQHQIGTFFCISGCNTVTDGSTLSVT